MSASESFYCAYPKHIRRPKLKFDFALIKEIRRSSKAHTQGFVFDQDRIIESTGAYNAPSILNSIDLETGVVTELARTPDGASGEGLARFDNKLVQLTYTAKKVFIYDAHTFQLIKEIKFSLTDEGWGIAKCAEGFVISDGSHRLFVVDEQTFSTKRVILVHDEGTPLGGLNQLQVVGHWVYANVFKTNDIAVIDIRTGDVVSIIDMSDLLHRFTDVERNEIFSDWKFVFNGIAYNPATKNFYVTGKNWPKIFEVRFLPVPNRK